MPSRFDRQFQKAGFPFLKAEFGEPITYHPLAGGVRSIIAIVERDPPAVWDAGGNVVLPRLAIRVDNNCKTGVQDSEVNTGGDTVKALKEVGDDQPTTFSVILMTDHDSGVVRLALA